mgnify:CR=1 FL=1
MKTKYSIECWIVDCEKEQALLLTVPAEGDTPAFNQPVTGGIEAAETPLEACVREIREETGLNVKPEDLKLIRDGYTVQITPTLQIQKTLYLLQTQTFPPTLSPKEHTTHIWTPFNQVNDALYYESNRVSWGMVGGVSGGVTRT